MRSRWLYNSYLYCKRATTTKSNVARFTTHESNLSCHKSANKPSWPILLGQWRRYYQCDKNQIFSCGTKRDWSRANRVGLSCSQSEHKICSILPARGLSHIKVIIPVRKNIWRPVWFVLSQPSISLETRQKTSKKPPGRRGRGHRSGKGGNGSSGNLNNTHYPASKLSGALLRSRAHRRTCSKANSKGA